MHRLPALCLGLLFLFGSVSAQRSFITSGESWKYRADGVDIGTAWRSLSYKDRSWSSGISPLGFGNGDEATVVPSGPADNHFITTYFRKSVYVGDPLAYTSYTVQIKRDDGIVLYLNGVEIYRGNMPLGTVSYSTLASTSVSDDGNVWVAISLDRASLRTGNNLFAAEVHQSAATSSDLKFDLTFTGNTTAPATVNEVQYKWAGALQPTSATVVAKLTSASSVCRVVVSPNANLSNPMYSPYRTASASVNYMVKMPVTNLAPGTLYYYAIESNGAVDNSSNDVGTFTTPSAGAFSYRFVVGSCVVSSDHQVYTAMKGKSPLFYMSTGDLHYGNPNSGTDINVHRSQYEQRILMREPARYFFNNVPLAYMWDDHDFSGDNSNYYSEGRSNARKAYQEYIPHYSLPAGSGDVPIYQAFTIGRIRFILTDLRSERTTSNIMSARQKDWFKQECLQARDQKQIIAWVSGVSFGGTVADNWGGYKTERTELSDFFRDNQIKNMFILSGDAHMIAIDNGSNHDFSTGSNNPNNYPVFQAAALNNKGSTKGGTYSEGGTFPNPDATVGQYGVVDVTDNGGSDITIMFTAYRTAGNTTTESVLTSYTFTRTLGTGTTLAARSLDVDGSVQLAWDVSDSTQEYTIAKSADGIEYHDLHTVNTATGSIVDHNATTGWNYYTLYASGKEPVRERIFIKGKVNLQLAPNPAQGYVTAFLDNISNVSSARYILYNMKMKTELQGDMVLHDGENTFELDVTPLPAGEYILNVVLNGREISEKLIIVK
jgi:hypothetical protein